MNITDAIELPEGLRAEFEARGVQTFAGRQSRYSHGTEARSVTTGNACGLSRLAVPLLPGPQLQGDPDRRVTALHEVT
ncbi:hypothetical protein [Burkholderia cenocepacia]|uniref:hypothetical protein n=1 Tax=Burkholderia cenocepacia TaxID=95486 RepID=UPI001588721F|nr:hypothetical protein [Burkholderia cenocepacia]